MRILLLLLLSSLLGANVLSFNMQPQSVNNYFMGIKILDQKKLTFDNINGVKFTGLSDIAYDKKSQILYMIGDRGALFSFSAKFKSKIDKLHPLKAVELKNKKGQKLRHWKRDSEGLTLNAKGHLLVSFEGDAKIAWFHKNSKQMGRSIRSYALPKILRSKKNYRSKNKSLEALAWHTKYGIITAAEWPLKYNNKKKQTLYALNGRRWHFKAEPEEKSAVVAIEVMDDGNILVLERSYTGLLDPFVITLKKVWIQGCKTKICPSAILAKFNNHKGWDIDNFEGLARISTNRYVMISDDNNNFFQKTLLIYFEVL